MKPTPTGSLLIVDDSEANREMLALCFRQHGYDVTVARDGTQALELVRGTAFDLVVLDITMPGTNGFTVLQALRADYPATALPIIMATALDESETIVRAMELGANDYVVKPYDFRVLLARAQTHLALKQTVAARRQLERHLEQRNEELEAANRKLAAAYRRTRRDLQAGARIQEALLPKGPPRVDGVRAAWKFRPCEELAGDTLNIFPLDDDHVGLYLLDVSGHGVAAALLSVTLSRVLSPVPDASSLLVQNGDSGPRIVPVTEVAEYLNQRFPWDADTEQYFTIVYGVLELETGLFRYVTAGHPGPVLLRRDGAPEILGASSLPIGIGGQYEEHTLVLQPGDRLYIYSDGIPEAPNRQGEPFGKEQLLAALAASRETELEEGLVRLLQRLQEWSGTARPADDVSVLGIEYTGRECHDLAAPAQRGSTVVAPVAHAGAGSPGRCGD